MQYKDIKNSNLILSDNLNLLKKKNININEKVILSLCDEDDSNKNVYNFYKLIDNNKQKKFEISSSLISKEFHDSLNVNLGLKKNLTRIFYGHIGLFSYYDLLNNLLVNNNKITIHTEENKIANIAKYFENSEEIDILYYREKYKKNNYFKIPIYDLFKMYSFDEIKFFLKKKFFKNFKKFKKLKNNVFVHLSTELNFISIDSYLNNKWQSKILEIDNNDIDSSFKIENEVLNNIKNTTINISKKYFDGNIAFSNSLISEFELFLRKYFYCYKKISNIFNNLNSNFYFLTKIIRGPIATSLYDYGKINKKNFFWISHQHGHGIELSDIHKKTLLTKEETLCDLLLVYSPIGKEKRKNNSFKNDKVIINDIGYHSNNYKLNKVPDHDIIYISNFNQELTGHEINMSSLTNFEKLKFEENLIKNVFSNTKHKVLFKEYPGTKNSKIKTDYMKDLIKPYKNIIYFDKWLNAENIYKKSSLILTSLPTSGLGGAIDSNTPLIFMDIKKIMPLNKNLIENFKNYFFYYEYNDKIFDNLKELLNMNLSDICNEWSRKESIQKREFINKYFNPKHKSKVTDNLKMNINDFVKVNEKK